MDNVQQERFWKSVELLELLYRARGATVSISRYDSKTMREAAQLMKIIGAGQVWEGVECERMKL
jgi:hypothetical protein